MINGCKSKLEYESTKSVHKVLMVTLHINHQTRNGQYFSVLLSYEQFIHSYPRCLSVDMNKTDSCQTMEWQRYTRCIEASEEKGLSTRQFNSPP